MAVEAPYRALESFTRHGVQFKAGAVIDGARMWPDLREKQRAGLVSWEEGREADAEAAKARRARLVASNTSEGADGVEHKPEPVATKVARTKRTAPTKGKASARQPRKAAA